MKKSLWTLLAVGWMAASSATPPAHLVDSLKSACQSEPDARKRVDILLNLKDLNDSSEDELYYSRKLFERGGRRRGRICRRGVAGVARFVLHLFARCRGFARPGAGAGGAADAGQRHGGGSGSYYRMVELARRIQVAGAEESARLCREYIDSVRTLPPGDVYEEASRLFLKGIAAFRLVSAEGNLQMERGLPFWNDELALLGADVSRRHAGVSTPT